MTSFAPEEFSFFLVGGGGGGGGDSANWCPEITRLELRIVERKHW